MDKINTRTAEVAQNVSSPRFVLIWRALQSVLALLLAISIWSLLEDPFEACRTCGTVARRIPAAIVGIIGYSALLSASFVRRLELFVIWGVFLAFGGHAFLAANLLIQDLVCYKCFGAFACCAVCVILISLLFPSRLLVLGMGSAVTAGLLQIGSPWILPFEARHPALDLLSEEDFSQTEDSVTVVVFQHEGSVVAELFKAEVEPLLQKEFGSRVRVYHRTLGHEENLADPTFVVGRGKDDAVVFSGFAEYAVFRGRILKRLENSKALP